MIAPQKPQPAFFFSVNSAEGAAASIASITTEAAQVIDTKRGYSLPWLEWLLLKNNKVIVNNYDVKLGPNINSRTGNAIMVSSNNNWRVPPQFAGSQASNWTTRAIERVDKQIESIIQKAIEDNI